MRGDARAPGRQCNSSTATPLSQPLSKLGKTMGLGFFSSPDGSALGWSFFCAGTREKCERCPQGKTRAIPHDWQTQTRRVTVMLTPHAW